MTDEGEDITINAENTENANEELDDKPEDVTYTVQENDGEESALPDPAQEVGEIEETSQSKDAGEEVEPDEGEVAEETYLISDDIPPPDVDTLQGEDPESSRAEEEEAGENRDDYNDIIIEEGGDFDETSSQGESTSAEPRSHEPSLNGIESFGGANSSGLFHREKNAQLMVNEERDELAEENYGAGGTAVESSYGEESSTLDGSADSVDNRSDLDPRLGGDNTQSDHRVGYPAGYDDRSILIDSGALFAESGLPKIHEDRREKLPRLPLRKEIASHHQWTYKPAARVLRNPFGLENYPPRKSVCCPAGEKSLPHTGHYAGPDRRHGALERRRMKKQYLERPIKALTEPNPTATVPMRPRTYKRTAWSARTRESLGQSALSREEAEQNKAERDKAKKMGYETLVGNLIYYQIPNAVDLNRSWKHYLDRDPMSWGFPYLKGSRERPSLPLPSPYLVHQLREPLWRFPRSRLIAHTPGNTTED